VTPCPECGSCREIGLGVGEGRGGMIGGRGVSDTSVPSS
jgi:hypothetical protein